MKASLAIAFLLLFCFSVAAQISITRAIPENVTAGSTITVTFSLENNGPATTAIIQEKIGSLQIQESSLIKKETYSDNYGYPGEPSGGLEVRLLEWEISLAKGEKKSLTYHILADKLGSFTLPPTQAITPSGTYHSRSNIVYVLCSSNGKCEPENSENFLNCKDCSTGLADGMCDLAEDGKNDPDCEYGADPDYNEGADSDFDGVPDGKDRCPLTQDEKADSSGCSCSQKDCADSDPKTLDSCDSASAECLHQKMDSKSEETVQKSTAQTTGFDNTLLLGAALVVFIGSAGAFLFFKSKRK